MSAYGTWGQNDMPTMLSSLRRAAERKTEIAERHAFGGYDEVWLLISCGIPELGAVVSSFVMTALLGISDLAAATSDVLTGSRYDRVFLHPILADEKAIYQWTARDGWEKHVVEVSPECRSPSFWEIADAFRGRR